MLVFWPASVNRRKSTPFPISLLLSILPGWFQSYSQLDRIWLSIAIPFFIHVAGCRMADPTARRRCNDDRTVRPAAEC
jgi:hypothetical protein